MSEHHFLIKYDTKSNAWDWSVETEMAHFPNGTIWLEDKELWTKNNYNKALQDIDDNLAESLGLAIHGLNKRGK